MVGVNPGSLDQKAMPLPTYWALKVTILLQVKSMYCHYNILYTLVTTRARTSPNSISQCWTAQFTVKMSPWMKQLSAVLKHQESRCVDFRFLGPFRVSLTLSPYDSPSRTWKKPSCCKLMKLFFPFPNWTFSCGWPTVFFLTPPENILARMKQFPQCDLTRRV